MIRSVDDVKLLNARIQCYINKTTPTRRRVWCLPYPLLHARRSICMQWSFKEGPCCDRWPCQRKAANAAFTTHRALTTPKLTAQNECASIQFPCASRSAAVRERLQNVYNCHKTLPCTTLVPGHDSKPGSVADRKYSLWCRPRWTHQFPARGRSPNGATKAPVITPTHT